MDGTLLNSEKVISQENRNLRLLKLALQV
ncbi:hypothetical protein O9993_05705 [Vibrio lentus]|nr:hypothetical protein [Vibrio lentus]